MNLGLNNLGLNNNKRFSPSRMFAGGEQGVWFDPSDLNSMYQESTGVTPVTAVGQTVGLILDKREGLRRGPGLWADASVTFEGESSRVSAGVYRIYTSAGVLSSALIAGALTTGKYYEVTFTVDSIASAGQGITVEGVGSPTVTTTGQKRCIVQATGTTLRIKRGGVVLTDYQISNVSAREVAGNHATQGTSASRPILRQDASGYYYLEFDGLNYSMATSAIDFTATDKMTVVAGVHKASDAAVGIIAELGNSLPVGGIYLAAPNSAGPSLGYASKGTLQATAQAASGYAAPITAVLTGTSDIASDACGLRVNGALAASSLADQGTGAYRSDLLYIGARGGSTLPFNGRLYGLIVRGAATQTSDLMSLEKWMGQKAGIAL